MQRKFAPRTCSCATEKISAPVRDVDGTRADDKAVWAGAGSRGVTTTGCAAQARLEITRDIFGEGDARLCRAPEESMMALAPSSPLERVHSLLRRWTSELAAKHVGQQSGDGAHLSDPEQKGPAKQFDPVCRHLRTHGREPLMKLLDQLQAELRELLSEPSFESVCR